MEYGSDEHLDGLSRNALKTEVRWWHDRATEMEGECERLQAENVELQDENARLRSCLSDDAENARMIMAENEKLRERVEMYEGTPQEEYIAYLRDENVDWEERYRELAAQNAKLRELVALMYRDMQGVLDMSTDTVWVDDVGTLMDEMDCHMQAMAELGMPHADYERRMRELGVEVDG